MTRPAKVSRNYFLNDQHDIGHSRLDEGAEEPKYPLEALSRLFPVILAGRFYSVLKII